MAEFRLSEEAEAELDEIWLYVARASGSIETATRVVENISDRFWLLARHPNIGRKRDDDLYPGIRSLLADDYVILHRVQSDDVVLILHVIHSSRDLAALLEEGNI